MAASAEVVLREKSVDLEGELGSRVYKLLHLTGAVRRDRVLHNPEALNGNLGRWQGHFPREEHRKRC